MPSVPHVTRSAVWRNMIAPLLVLTSIVLAPASGDPNLADEILLKQGECDVLFEKAGNTILDEGGDKFPNIPRDDYFKCKDEVDDMKRKYISTVLLGPSFYPELFPVRLSNGTLVMLPVPSQKKQLSVANNPLSCPWAEGLCMVSKKCAGILNDMNENKTLTDVSYYKTKYLHCIILFDDLKLKYIRENNISIELVKRAGELTVQCKEGIVSFSLPKSLEDQNNKLEESEEHSDKDVLDNKQISSQNLLDNKLSLKDKLHEMSDKKVTKENNDIAETEVHDINYIPYSKENSMTIDKATNNRQKNVAAPEKFDLNPKDAVMDVTGANAPNNMLKPSVAILDYTSTIPKSKKLGDDINSRMLSDDAEKVVKVVSYREKIVSSNLNENSVNYNFASSDNNIQSAEGSGKVAEEGAPATPKSLENAGSEISATKYNAIQGDIASDSFNKIEHHLVTATPMPEIMGDEIFEREADCGAFLKTANEILDERAFESIPYYDTMYAECMSKADKLKHEYIKRHHLDVTQYKAVFPVILSSGVEKLVTLPLTVSDPPTNFNPGHLTLEPDSHTGFDKIFSDPEDLDWPDHQDEFYLSASHKKRVMMENPAFISNKDFFEYFNQNPLGDSESTLSRFANMLRKNGGRTEKKTGE